MFSTSKHFNFIDRQFKTAKNGSKSIQIDTFQYNKNSINEMD